MHHNRSASSGLAAGSMPRARALLRASKFVSTMLFIAVCMVPCQSFAGTTSVSGHVTDHLTGAALSGIRISIWYQLGPFFSQEIGSPTTATDGSYAWSGVCPAFGLTPCHISIYDEHYIDADTTFTGDEPEVIADFALIEPATISGDIRIDGAVPASPLNVTLSYYSDIDQRWMSLPSITYQEENGHYSIGRLPPEVPYRLCAGGPGYGAIEQCFDQHDQTSLSQDPPYDFVTVREGGEREDIDFTLRSGGGIEGTLHDGYLGGPLADTGIHIDFYDENGTLLDGFGTTSDSNGRYHIAGLPDGAYYVGAIIIGPFIDSTQVYPGIVCDNEACPPATNGQQLSISGAASITSIDFTVHPEAVIRGHVTDAASGEALGGVPIYATYHDLETTTAADTGEFVFYVDTGTFPFAVFTRGAQPYIDQVYPGIACIQDPCTDAGQTFSPSRGDVIEHVDFALQPGSAIAGTIYDAATGLPRIGNIYVYDSEFNIVWSQLLDESGSYTSGAWYPGTYYVKADGFPGYPGLDGCAFYDAVACPADDQDPATVTPTPLTLSAGEIRGGIDFHLNSDSIFNNGFD